MLRSKQLPRCAATAGASGIGNQVTATRFAGHLVPRPVIGPLARGFEVARLNPVETVPLLRLGRAGAAEQDEEPEAAKRERHAAHVGVGVAVPGRFRGVG